MKGAKEVEHSEFGDALNAPRNPASSAIPLEKQRDVPLNESIYDPLRAVGRRGVFDQRTPCLRSTTRRVEQAGCPAEERCACGRQAGCPAKNQRDAKNALTTRNER